MRLQNRPRRRAGSILPLLVICVVALMGMLALAVDIGLVAIARTQAQGVADLAALTGARLLNGDTSNSGNLNNVTTATAAAHTAAGNNKLLGAAVPSSAITATPGVYTYDSTAQQFSASFPGNPGSNAWSVMRVAVNTTTPTYFGRVWGISSFAVKATATAAHKPRDLALILDFSGSMKFGSESALFIGNWSDLYGSMNADPVYPKFGQYYAMSQRPLASGTTSPSGNGSGYNPLQRTVPFADSYGYVYSPSNLTAGPNGGPPGDLYVVLKVREHPFLERHDYDLYCSIPINVAQAALGDEIEIPTLEQPHKLKIPEGTQTGTEFRIRNKGVPHVNSHGRGDLVVQVQVNTPTKLTREQKRLFEQLRETLPTDNKPNEKGLFEKVKDYFM